MNLLATIFELSLLSIPVYLEYCYPLGTALVLSPLIILAMIRTQGSSPKIIGKRGMKAAIYDCSMPNKVKFLNDYPIPSYSSNQMFVKIYASAINPVDYKLITPKVPILRWLIPNTVGRDFSGVVLEVGKNVLKFKVGDEIFGKAYGGVLQEYTIVNENDVAKKPNHLNWLEAGGLSLVGLTSLQALTATNLKKDQNIIIIGASGACGSLGVIIAKKFGARVTGVCSSSNSKKVRDLGADKVIEYDKAGFLNDIAGEKFDTIYDTVTSFEDPDQKKIFIPYLKPNTGRYVAINSKHIHDFLKAILKINYGRDKFVLTRWTTNELEQLASLVDSNVANQIIDSNYELSQKGVDEAFEKQKSRRAKGKLVFKLF